MRLARASTVVFLCFVLVFSTSAQQSPTSAPSVTAAGLLQNAFTALAGSNNVTDVTLTGTTERIAGSDDESGTATLKAVSGASLLNLSFASGTRSEVLNTSATPPAGSWSGPDGISHAISYHNLLTDPGWFFPLFVAAHGLSASGYVVTYVGQETFNSVAVQHLTISQTFSSLPSDTSATFQHLSQLDLYLDTTSFLPVALAFNIHPDDNMLLDIPIQVQFSDYRAVNGVQVPFHVQKYLNNGLILDLQFQSVVFNSGLSATAFAVPSPT